MRLLFTPWRPLGTLDLRSRPPRVHVGLTRTSRSQRLLSRHGSFSISTTRPSEALTSHEGFPCRLHGGTSWTTGASAEPFQLGGHLCQATAVLGSPQGGPRDVRGPPQPSPVSHFSSKGPKIEDVNNCFAPRFSIRRFLGTRNLRCLKHREKVVQSLPATLVKRYQCKVPTEGFRFSRSSYL